jgi:hypothetical protein
MTFERLFSEDAIEQFLTQNAGLVERSTPEVGRLALQSEVDLYIRFVSHPITPALGFQQLQSLPNEDLSFRVIYLNSEIADLWEQFVALLVKPSPLAPMGLPSLFGGFLTYSPWVQLPSDVLRTLPVVLERAGRVDYAEECENGEIIADWRLICRGAGELITHRAEVILFRDGPDWGGEDEDAEGECPNIGVVYCRRDIDQTSRPDSIAYLVHVPPDEWQTALLEACSDWPRDLVRGGDHLKTLTAYLDTIVNDAAAWQTLPLSDVLNEEG